MKNTDNYVLGMSDTTLEIKTTSRILNVNQTAQGYILVILETVMVPESEEFSVRAISSHPGRCNLTGGFDYRNYVEMVSRHCNWTAEIDSGGSVSVAMNQPILTDPIHVIINKVVQTIPTWLENEPHIHRLHNTNQCITNIINVTK